MKNKFRKLFALLSVSLILCSCKNNEEKKEEDVNKKPPETGINLVENGKSDYKIIYSSGSSVIINAASELSTFIYESSGVTIPYSLDNGEKFNPSTKVISIGNTEIYKGTGLEITNDMHKTGYYLKRFDNTLVLNAYDVNGIIGGVYDLLNYTIDLEFYSDDEYEFSKMDKIPLLDFNMKFIPFIDVRGILQKPLTKQYNQRLRLYAGEGKGHWITFAHTVITEYLPFSVYGADHPDWYNSGRTQVCYSNEEMRHEMAKQIEKRIEDNPDGQYVMIGHEDNWDICDCDACKHEMEMYGGYSGQELVFTNKISEEVDAWLKDNQPGRRVEYVFFAYQTSQNPPIKTNRVDGKDVPVFDANGKYIPYYDNFNIRDDVIVIYCPIDADFSKPFNESTNTPQYQQLKGWSDIFHGSNLYNNILIWSYSLAVRDYMIPFNQFGAIKDQLKFYKDLGACYVMDQSYYDSCIPCFESLTLYCKSKLMYNIDLNYNDLVNDFINHYYGPAGSTFKQYYNFFRNYYTSKGVTGAIFSVISGQSIWPLETVDFLMSLLNKCLEEIEPLRQTDPIRFNKLNDRIRRERLTPIYMYLKNYMSALTYEQKVEYVFDMAKYTTQYEIVGTGEGYNDMATLVGEWQDSLTKRG